ncbi:MAG: TatD family hydrolase [Candidatus Doudnabacteria bacterium]
MYFDTHTHVNFSAFKEDRDQIVKRALDAETWMINVGTQTDTSQSAVDLAKDHPEGVYAAIGLHPVHTYQQMLDEEESHFQSRAENFEETDYEPMLSDKVVAIGECGLDYFRLPLGQDPEPIKRRQKQEFIKQLEFAKKHGLPVIIHCRDAYSDLIEILKSEYEGLPGVAHSFTDNWETAKKFLDLGFYIALNGILTFDKTGKLAEVVEKSPFDRLLTETDAPYLTPPPYRGKRNEPSYVRHVAARMAEIRKLNVEEVGQKTFENACELFGIKKRSAG